MSTDAHNELGGRAENKRSAISRMVVGCSQKFRVKPSQEFQAHVVDLLDRTLKLYEAEKLLEFLPKSFDHFPSLAQIEECLPNFREKALLSRTPEGGWTSKRAPGTPASIEALFVLIEKGLSNTAAFRTGMRYVKATDEEMWDWFNEWAEGRIHIDLARRKHDLLKPWKEALAMKGLGNG